MPRRRAGVLLPLEEDILEIGLRRLRDGEPEFHGFAVATELQAAGGRRLTAHGTLYKALGRLADGGLLRSRWETDEECDGTRPRRRLYVVSDGAAAALSASRSAHRHVGRATQPGMAPT